MQPSNSLIRWSTATLKVCPSICTNMDGHWCVLVVIFDSVEDREAKQHALLPVDSHRSLLLLLCSHRSAPVPSLLYSLALSCGTLFHPL